MNKIRRIKRNVAFTFAALRLVFRVTHILFDRGLIGIDPSDFRVVVGSKIGDSPYCEFDGKPLQLPKDANARPNEDYIAASFKKFSETQLAS